MSADRRHYEIPMLDEIDPSEAVALPNDVPAPPSLGHLPTPVLHSATVETLIGQNEDLHARLTVTIRLNAQLERRIMELEQTQNDQRNMNGSLISQMQILQEKDGSWKNRLDELETMIATKTHDSDRQHVEIALLSKQLNDKTSALDTLKNRLIEASSHIQAQEKSMGDLQSQLANEFEERLGSVLTEYNKQAELVKELQGRVSHLAQLDENRIESENRAIFFERRAQELEEKFGGELGLVQSHLDAYRVEAKTLVASLQTKSEALVEQTRIADQAQTALTQIEDQFESLQTIWHEGQRKLDESRLKNDALTKINAELSRKLKELRRLDGLAPAISAAPAVEAANQNENQKFDRIESLLAGIQAGFPQSIIESESAEKDSSASPEL